MANNFLSAPSINAVFESWEGRARWMAISETFPEVMDNRSSWNRTVGQRVRNTHPYPIPLVVKRLEMAITYRQQMGEVVEVLRPAVRYQSTVRRNPKSNPQHGVQPSSFITFSGLIA